MTTAQSIVGRFIDDHVPLSEMVHMDLSLDGNQWSVLYGPNLQEGIAGFGNTPSDAVADFNVQANENKRTATQLIWSIEGGYVKGRKP